MSLVKPLASAWMHGLHADGCFGCVQHSLRSKGGKMVEPALFSGCQPCAARAHQTRSHRCRSQLIPDPRYLDGRQPANAPRASLGDPDCPNHKSLDLPFLPPRRSGPGPTCVNQHDRY